MTDNKTLYSNTLTGFYTGWLLPAAMVGLAVFLYGLFTLGKDSLSIIRQDIIQAKLCLEL